MFSYTDDAIVTSSPTGRHLSTVIRRPAAIGPLDWNEHAEQVCKVLNELDRNAKLNYRVCYSLGAGFQTVGRVKRTYAEAIRAELKSAHVHVEATGNTAKEMYADTIAGARIAELEGQLDDATTKLAAAQMLLEQADGKLNQFEEKLTDASRLRHLKVPQKILTALATACPGTAVHFKDQKITIESV